MSNIELNQQSIFVSGQRIYTLKKKTISNNTKALFYILVNFFSYALTWFVSKSKSETSAETPQTKRRVERLL